MRRLFALGLAVAAAGCSFVLDFPDRVEDGGGDQGGESAGGASAGGGNGGASGECPSEFEEIVWHGRSSSGTADDYVVVTGLARNGGGTPWLDMFGESSRDIDGFAFPSSPANLLFALRATDAGAVGAIGSIVPCDVVPDYPFAGRVSLRTDDRLFISGGLPALDGSTYGFSPGETDNCEMGVVETVTSGDSEFGGLVPYHALLEPTGALIDISQGSVGLTLASTVNADVTAGIGVAFGDAFGGRPGDDDLRYFVVRSPEEGGGNEVIFLAHANTEDYHRDLPGALDVAQDQTVWATGYGCPTNAACTGTGSAFITRVAPGGGPIETSIEGADFSFGSAVRAGGGAMFVGGGYRGELVIDGEPLEPSEDVGAFVAAFDTAAKTIRWVYPAPGVPLPFDGAGFDGVVDIALADGAECGAAVYVAGCVVTSGDTGSSCSAHRVEQRGRHTFVLKLDAATGDLLWSGEIVPDDPATGLFIPTAIAADSTGFWLATVLHGRVPLPSPGQPTESGDGTESLVLRLSP